MDRERLENTFIYVASDPDKAAEQIYQRRAAAVTEPGTELTALSEATVIEVLIETIHAGCIQISPSMVAKRLSKRGFSVNGKQVEQIFNQYGIPTEKKTL